MVFGRQLQTPSGNGGDFMQRADNGGQAGRLQAFLHGPENVRIVFTAHLDNTVGINAEVL